MAHAKETGLLHEVWCLQTVTGLHPFCGLRVPLVASWSTLTIYCRLSFLYADTLRGSVGRVLIQDHQCCVMVACFVKGVSQFWFYIKNRSKWAFTLNHWTQKQDQRVTQYFLHPNLPALLKTQKGNKTKLPTNWTLTASEIRCFKYLLLIGLGRGVYSGLIWETKLCDKLNSYRGWYFFVEL